MSAAPLVLSLKKRLQAAVAANKTEVSHPTSPASASTGYYKPDPLIEARLWFAGDD